MNSETTHLWTFLFGILLKQYMTFWVFFHWLKLKCSLVTKLILYSIILLILPSSFFAGLINLTWWLFVKLSLWSFNVKWQLFSPLIFMRFRLSLFFKICLPAILIFFLIELFAILFELFARSSSCSYLHNRYMFYVLSANVSVFWIA